MGTTSQLTHEMHNLTNTSLMLKRKLERYAQAVASEKAPGTNAVDTLFSEAGVHFSENIKRTLEDARFFHEAIVQNRKLFLKAELVQLENELKSQNVDFAKKADERANLMRLLEGHGALEEYSLLQEKITEKQTSLEGIKAKIADIKKISLRKEEIKISKLELGAKLQRDYEQSRSEWEKAVMLFSEISDALYNEPGNLIINTSEKGYKFDIDIKRSSSEGIGKMKIFCYDLMLVELMTEKKGINFLVHDSSLYDGVDSRQQAHALQNAHKKAMDKNFQYICTFNSDMIPHDELEPEFNIAEFVRLTLKDQNSEDSLLGFHFELTKTKK